MTISEIIQANDEIEIHAVQKMGQAVQIAETPSLYKSRVLHVGENGILQITMPVENGKQILLSLDTRYDFLFYSGGGLYQAIGRVRERYKKENICMLDIELKSDLVKYKKRKYFRWPCSMELLYYRLPEETQLKLTQGMECEIRSAPPAGSPASGKAVSLSGGGIRFHTEEKLASGMRLYVEFCLKNETMDKDYRLMAEVTDCRELENRQDARFETYAEFLMQDEGIREEIIRYIFGEEQKMRRRGKLK